MFTLLDLNYTMIINNLPICSLQIISFYVKLAITKKNNNFHDKGKNLIKVAQLLWFLLFLTKYNILYKTEDLYISVYTLIHMFVIIHKAGKDES